VELALAAARLLPEPAQAQAWAEVRLAGPAEGPAEVPLWPVRGRQRPEEVLPPVLERDAVSALRPVRVEARLSP